MVRLLVASAPKRFLPHRTARRLCLILNKRLAALTPATLHQVPHGIMERVPTLVVLSPPCPLSAPSSSAVASAQTRGAPAGARGPPSALPFTRRNTRLCAGIVTTALLCYAAASRQSAPSVVSRRGPQPRGADGGRDRAAWQPKETCMRYIFGDYTLDPARYELRRAGVLVPVEPRAFDLLAYLVQHAGQIVPKEELFTQLWAEQFVTDSALTYCVIEVRKAIGDSGRGQRCIRTVHGRGYRFIVPVAVQPQPGTAAQRPPAPIPRLSTAGLAWIRPTRRSLSPRCAQRCPLPCQRRLRIPSRP
jgi:DNA-binding winged helix-turn-helix (wHTH) protein